MLIGIDASRANKEHKSGTEWYSYYLIRWLAKLDKDNQYILYSNAPLGGGLLDLTTRQYFVAPGGLGEIKFDRKGYQIIKSPNNNFRGKVLKWPFYFFWTQGRMSLEMLIHRPDILFVPAHTLPIIHPRKSIVTIHDIGFVRDRLLYKEEAMGSENARMREIINIFVRLFTLGKYRASSIDYLRWSTEYALKKAKKVISVSGFTKRELTQLDGTNPEKIKVIHNGYNKYLYRKINNKNETGMILKKYGIEGPYILYIGRIEKKKNIPALIEAFAIMRENNKDIRHKLVLIGDASFGYDEANYMIEEFGLNKEVIMPGWIPEEEMPYFYSGADAFVFPSRYEGFGIPLLQAMACEVPIVASCVSSIPEIVDEAALFFDPYNVRSMAKALKKIISDRQLGARLVKLGRERIKDFSWEKCTRKTLEEINEL